MRIGGTVVMVHMNILDMIIGIIRPIQIHLMDIKGLITKSVLATVETIQCHTITQSWALTGINF